MQEGTDRMSTGQQGPPKPRGIVQSWTAEDWQCAMSLAPVVEQTLRRACQLHQKTPVFDTDGALTLTVRPRLNRLSAKKFALAVGPVLAALQARLNKLEVGHDATEAEEQLAGQPDVGPALARLAACRLDFPREFAGELSWTDSGTDPEDDPDYAPADDVSTQAVTALDTGHQGADDPPSPEMPDSKSSTETSHVQIPAVPIDVQMLRHHLDDLDRQHTAVIDAATCVLDDVQSGQIICDERFLVLQRWNEQLRHSATVAGIDTDEATIEGLRSAMEAIETAQAACLRQQQLAEWVRALADVRLSAGAEPVLRPVLNAIGKLDPAPLDDMAESHMALQRLLTTPAWEVHDDDTGIVEAAFGRRVMLVAVSEVLGSGPMPGSNRNPAGANAQPPPPPSSTLKPDTEPSFAWRQPADKGGMPLTAGCPEEPARPNNATNDPDKPAVPAEPEPTAVSPAGGAATEQAVESLTPEEPVEPDTSDEATPPAQRATSTNQASEGELRAEPRQSVESDQTASPELTTQQNSKLTETQGSLDPRVAAAIATGRPTLAYWYSVALDETPEVRSILEVLALADAITTDGDDTATRIRVLLRDFDIASISGDTTLLKIAACALARVALRMPFSPATALLDDACELLADEGPPFLHAIQQAAARGVELQTLQDQNRRALPELIGERDDALAALRDHLKVAAEERMHLGRTSNIWRHLLATNGYLGGVMGRTLAKPSDLTPAEELLRNFQDTEKFDKVLGDLDARLHPVATRKSGVVAKARAELREHTGSLLAVLQEYTEAEKAVTAREHQQSSNDAPEVLEILTRAVSTETDVADGDPRDPGNSTLVATRAWVHDVLRRRTELPRHGMPPGHALARELTLSYEVDRELDGSIVASSVTVEGLQALQVREPEGAYDGFVARDDHLGVEQLLDALRAQGQKQLAEKLAERQREDVKISHERLRKLINDTDRTLSLALSTALLSESESTALRADVERLRADLANDFVAARRELQRIIDRVGTARAQALEQARQQLKEYNPPAQVTERISKLLDDGDLVNAQEFLSQVAAGAQELPAEATSDNTLSQFWPAFTQAADQASQSGQPGSPGLDWLLALASAGGELAGRTVLPPDASPLIAEGLQSWAWLARHKRRNGHIDHLKTVLGLLGLEVKSLFDQKETASGLRWWATVQADRVGQALVPAYGSSSNGRYQVLLCWDRLSADRLLDLVEERPITPPTIVLYFHTLSMRERRSLADRSRPHNKNVSTVVIDHATIAFLATSHDIALQTALGISLPFTSINPYTPFALGDVPREVFYGRKAELRRVQDPHDALFVYGGRQLGKSALLKTALREFRDSDPRWRSVYADLKAEGIGEWRQSDDIWQVLLPQLIDAEIIDSKVTAKAPPEVIVNAIRRWLDADKDRRFLLLLDEADAFLETDAQARTGQVGDARAGQFGDARFINVYRLKRLMDGTGRRFKPVFAGLHQVQRFHTASNGPMAHVGAEIPIGPLPPTEAFKLVVKPLTAIGYQFETPDAVWRLLNYTNYQASLIQLFCDALVKRLHRRGLTAGAPPTFIDGDLVDEVYADKGLRDQIATRFDWTINLDNRYRVIAYATAWLSLNGTTQLFPPVTLHDECATFWPSGFADLSLDTFVAYLDEMVGLGVLVRTPEDHYGIRSPNVIRLLGSPEEIERRLEESDKLELSRPFDPARYRRALHGDPNIRSPLSELQAKQVLDTRTAVHLIVGTSALGLDRVAQALTEAGGDEVGVHVCSTATLAKTLTTLSRRVGRHHVVVDDRDAADSQALAGLHRLSRHIAVHDRLTASWLTPVGASWHETARLDVTPALQQIALQLWTDDALQAWAPECGYSLTSVKERGELLEATGGWPEVIEAAASAARRGMPAARARQQAVETTCGDKQRSQFLVSVGLRGDPNAEGVAEVIATWSDEIQFNDLGELVDIVEGELLQVVDRLVDMAVLRRSAGGDSYRLNPLIARLLQPDPG